MKILINMILFLFLVTFFSCGQETQNNYSGYSDLEIQTEKCLDNWLNSKDVQWDEVQSVFENYFSSANISNTSDAKAKQYEDILKYWERPSGQFPIFKDKKKIVAIEKKLGLTDRDIIMKKQLECFTNKYIANKASVDSTSSYYVFGDILETVKKVPDVSTGLIAGAINTSMDKSDLQKALYQKTIVLMYTFDMALYLSDGK